MKLSSEEYLVGDNSSPGSFLKQSHTAKNLSQHHAESETTLISAFVSKKILVEHLKEVVYFKIQDFLR
jgi:hypothetical protein